MSVSIIAIAALAAVFAGVSKGGFGSGAAFASAVMLALVMEPGAALGVMLPLLMLIDVATLKPYWGKWRWPEARVLVLYGVPGVVIGALFYTTVNSDVLRILIGGIAVFFVLWRLNGGVQLRAVPEWAGPLAGLAVGFTSFVSHAGGPPAAVYLLAQRLGKTEYQATSVLVFWLINIAKVGPYAAMGIFTWETLRLDLIVAPFALFGAWLGVKAHFLVSERLFFALTYVLLTVTGLKLIRDGLF